MHKGRYAAIPKGLPRPGLPAPRPTNGLSPSSTAAKRDVHPEHPIWEPRRRVLLRRSRRWSRILRGAGDAQGANQELFTARSGGAPTLATARVGPLSGTARPPACGVPRLVRLVRFRSFGITTCGYPGFLLPKTHRCVGLAKVRCAVVGTPDNRRSRAPAPQHNVRLIIQRT
jgi:hypothetical protein